LRRAFELAEQLLLLAQSSHDPALRLYARRALGSTLYWMGEFLTRECLENIITLYDTERHRPLIFSYAGTDARVHYLSYAAWTLWQLGYPDQALKRSNEALASAQKLSHPFNLAFAENFVVVLRQYRREVRAAQETAESMIALSAEHGFADFLAYATVLRGWSMAEEGHREDGIDQIREGLWRVSRDWRGTGPLVFSNPVGRGVLRDGQPRRRAECFDGSARRRG